MSHLGQNHPFLGTMKTIQSLTPVKAPLFLPKMASGVRGSWLRLTALRKGPAPASIWALHLLFCRERAASGPTGCSCCCYDLTCLFCSFHRKRNCGFSPELVHAIAVQGPVLSSLVITMGICDLITIPI